MRHKTNVHERCRDDTHNCDIAGCVVRSAYIRTFHEINPFIHFLLQLDFCFNIHRRCNKCTANHEKMNRDSTDFNCRIRQKRAHKITLA